MSEENEKQTLITELRKEVDRLLLDGSVTEDEKIIRMKKALTIIESGKEE